MTAAARAAAVAVAAAGLGGCGPRGAPAGPAGPTCDGPAIVSTQRDLDALAGCRRWSGDLTIRGAAALDLDPIGELVEVTGELVIGPTFDLDLVHLGVVRAGALRIVSNGVATGLFLPTLEEVGELEIAANLALAGVSAPRLREVAGAVTIRANPALERVDAAALVRVGGAIDVAENPALDAIEAPALR